MSRMSTSDLDTLEMNFPIKANKSEEDWKHSVNGVYSKHFYKSNAMIDHIAINLYHNQVEKQKEQESPFQQWCKKGDVVIGLTLLEVSFNSKVLPGCKHQESVNCSPVLFCLFQ